MLRSGSKAEAAETEAERSDDAHIVLATLNARYIHTAFGLRYLQANLGPLAARSTLLEFTTQARPLVIAEAILAHGPRIVGLGVYIWNTTETLALVRLLKTLNPALIVVLGGPEISFETESQPLFIHADHVIIGEGETAFARLCGQLLGPDPGSDPDADTHAPAKLIHGGLPDTTTLVLPYDRYTDTDIADRVIYVEASRGCPYRCAFCLSSLDKKVRNLPLDNLLHALQTLHDRGARSFKFVDRTFNLSPRTSEAILRFFLDLIGRSAPNDGLFLHFEMVPDRFPAALRALVTAFPAGAMQFEVGVQTLDPAVAARIDRRQDNEQTFANLRFLTEATGVHVHADLIVGLPGEDLVSFGRGFDRLRTTGVAEIQVGILKRLRGAPIGQHTAQWRMCYSPLPPYELLRNADISAADMGRMRRFARFWEVFANSGRFARTMPLLLPGPSAFTAFLAFSDWLHGHATQTHGLGLKRCVEVLFVFLTEVSDLDVGVVAAALADDYRRVSKKQHVPAILRGVGDHAERSENQANRANHGRDRRQRRHGEAACDEARKS